jgi:ribosomal protein S6--L-glutamate ligase
MTPSIGILVDWLNPCVTAAVETMRERGVHVDLIQPERQPWALDPRPLAHDLYVLKSGTDMALTLAGLLHAAGARTLNPFPTVVSMRNKANVMAALVQGGVPVPETWVTSELGGLVAALAAGPLILKPYRGSRGEGIRIVRDAAELEAITPDGPLVVQRFHPHGRDRKLYCIGGRVFGVKRIWPLRTYDDKLGEPFEPTPAQRDIVLRCGEIFDIDLFGLDLIESEGQPYVVDVNKFGSFMGVADAPRLLADHLSAAARSPAPSLTAQSVEVALDVLPLARAPA